jgi:hypothetical protein
MLWGGGETGARRWSLLRGKQASDDSQIFVETWKRSWLAGADARWASPSPVNPHTEDPMRAAWEAGCEWANGHPDRRKNTHLRLAHPRRRSTDAKPRLPSAVKAGAIGLGIFALSRWAWQRLRTRSSAEHPRSPQP